jgi:hypothetical protein
MCLNERRDRPDANPTAVSALGFIGEGPDRVGEGVFSRQVRPLARVRARRKVGEPRGRTVSLPKRRVPEPLGGHL